MDRNNIWYRGSMAKQAGYVMKKIGVKDRCGIDIKDGDWVSLDGNITADNSMGILPNGWHFEEDDIYQVYFDKRIENWSLKLDVEPDSAYNCKYMSHAVGLLHDGDVTVKIYGPENKVA